MTECVNKDILWPSGSDLWRLYLPGSPDDHVLGIMLWHDIPNEAPRRVGSRVDEDMKLSMDGTSNKQKEAPGLQDLGGVRGTPKNPSTSKETVGPVPRFLLVKRKGEKSEEGFNKVSPFIISKVLYGLIGETAIVKKTRDGLLIQTKSASQSKRMLEVKRFWEYDVEVIPHGTLNMSRGIVYCRDLLNCTVEEIKEELSSQGVIEVRRLKTKRNDRLVETANHVLTFNNPMLPKEIDIAFYRKLKVRPYIPPPTRCFRCQAFGHVADKCMNEKICSCGRPPHGETECDDPKKCVNCEGSHSAGFKGCPKYKTEEAIQKIRVVEKISYNEAKKKVQIETPRNNVSYATAAATAPLINDNQIAFLLPQIVETIKATLSETLSHSEIFKTQPRPIMPKYIPRERSDSVSTNQSTVSEVKKRDIPGTTSEEESALHQPHKKKRGWPKGQPRKQNNAPISDKNSEINL